MAVNHFSKLPNELQDLIFDALVDEVRVFVLSRASSASALKALWCKYCASDGTGHELFHAEDCNKAAIRSMKKVEWIRRTITSRPRMSDHIKSLTLAVPRYHMSFHIEDNTRQSRIIWQLPVIWRRDLLPGLLLRMTRLERLRLVALYIPRAILSTKAECAHTITFEEVDEDLGQVPLPPNIKHLCIEEEVPVDDPRGSWPRTTSSTTPREALQDIVEHFTGFQSVRHLHLKITRPENPNLARFQQFTSLETLRLDHCTSKGLCKNYCDLLLTHINPLRRLHTLELRFTADDMTCFSDNWPRLLSSVKTIRLPFLEFAQAFLRSSGSDELKFEVLFPYAVVQNRARKMSGAFSTAWKDPEQAIFYVEMIAKWLDDRRKKHIEENRTVTIKGCDWDDVFMEKPDIEEVVHTASVLHGALNVGAV